jgi:CheY-like chemotaxis protein
VITKFRESLATPALLDFKRDSLPSLSPAPLFEQAESTQANWFSRLSMRRKLLLALLAGASAYFSKPFNEQLLLQALEKMMAA